MDIDHTDRIMAFWDYLAEQPASRTHDSLHELLGFVAGLINARQAYWMGAIRLLRRAGKDSLRGWRPGAMQYWQPMASFPQVFRQGVRVINDGHASEVVINHVRNAGRFRAVLLKDHVSPAFFQSWHYDAYYLQRGLPDCLFVAVPVNADAEAYYCFYRGADDSPFTADDLEVAAFALRGLKWFQRLVMLDHGLLVAEQALSPVERRILRYLLTDQSEQQIAVHMGQSPATTHKYVTTLYRKFNARGRAGLTALWLSH